jgi:Fe2+ or Zn2+ uptake regulation protein
VYRNLTILAETDEIQKIDFGSTYDRFEANIAPHYHFVCENCGAIEDLDMPIDEQLNERVRQLTSLEPQHHKIQFFGLCSACKEG